MTGDQWTGDDAKRARRRVVRAARRVCVYVIGRDDGYYVQTTKAEAYRLIDTGQFTVQGDEETVYVEAMTR